MASVGRAELRKIAHLVAVIFRAARFRLTRRADLVWFAPAGPNAVPVLRDLVLLAIFGALGFIMRCNQLGIRVPDDVSVVGSDDIAGSAIMTPGLTTVHAPKELMGRAAVSLLLDHLVDGGPVICETLRGHLVVRDSTGTPRKE